MKKIITLILPMLLIVSACVSNIHTDYGSQYDFSSYQTFQLRAHKVESTETYDAFGGDIFDTRLHQAITGSLHSKGLSTAKTPDFFVAYSLRTEQRVQLSNTFPYRTSHPLHGRHGSYYQHSFEPQITDIRQFTVGVLTLKIIDAETNKTVWASNSQTVLRNTKSPTEAEAKIQERINEMLVSFPPNNVITL